MEHIWPLQDAKNKFSEVVNNALHRRGPQYHTPWCAGSCGIVL